MNSLDRYIDQALTLWLAYARPPRRIRMQVLLRAGRPEQPEPVTEEVPMHLVIRQLRGEYRDVQHRLAGRAQFYGSPFMLGALSLLS